MSAIDERKYFERNDRSLHLQQVFNTSGFLGVILSFFLNLIFRIYRIGNKNRNKKILIISLARLGDTVFTIPAINIILKKFGQFKVSIICYPESKTIYNLALQHIDIKTISKSDFYFGRRIARSKSRRFIKQLKPEIIFDLTGTISSATLICSSLAETVVGTNSEFVKTAYTHFGLRRKKPHLMDQYVDVVGLYSEVRNEDKEYRFPINLDIDKPILIHPFAIRESKEWDLSKYVELARRLKEKKYQVKIVSPDGYISEKDLTIIQDKTELMITPTLELLISAIGGASVFISNDSGPTYIASLIGKPTFTIYGPTNPAYSLPFGNHHQYFMKMIECSPRDNEQYCYTLGGIHCSHHKCLRELTVEEVETSVIKFLEQLKIEKLN